METEFCSWVGQILRKSRELLYSQTITPSASKGLSETRFDNVPHTMDTIVLFTFIRNRLERLRCGVLTDLGKSTLAEIALDKAHKEFLRLEQKICVYYGEDLAHNDFGVAFSFPIAERFRALEAFLEVSRDRKNNSDFWHLCELKRFAREIGTAEEALVKQWIYRATVQQTTSKTWDQERRKIRESIEKGFQTWQDRVRIIGPTDVEQRGFGRVDYLDVHPHKNIRPWGALNGWGEYYTRINELLGRFACGFPKEKIPTDGIAKYGRAPWLLNVPTTTSLHHKASCAAPIDSTGLFPCDTSSCGSKGSPESNGSTNSSSPTNRRRKSKNKKRKGKGIRAPSTPTSGGTSAGEPQLPVRQPQQVPVTATNGRPDMKYRQCNGNHQPGIVCTSCYTKNQIEYLGQLDNWAHNYYGYNPWENRGFAEMTPCLIRPELRDTGAEMWWGLGRGRAQLTAPTPEPSRIRVVEGYWVAGQCRGRVEDDYGGARRGRGRGWGWGRGRRA